MGKKPLYKAVRDALIFLMEKNKNIKEEYRLGNVVLGRKFSLGSHFQYRLAENLFDNTDKLVLVDKALSFPRKPRKKIRYPDITIIKNKALKGIIEVKIDIGYLNLNKYGIEKGEKKKYLYHKNQNNFMKQERKLLSKKYFTFRDKRKEKDSKEKIETKGKVPKLFLVATKINDHSRYPYFKKSVNDAGYSTLLVLENNHPNRPECTKKKIVGEVKRDKEEINEKLSVFF